MNSLFSKLNLNTIIQGDCIEEMKKLPEGIAKVIFAFFCKNVLKLRSESKNYY